MQLIRKVNKGTRFILSLIDIFGKYAWIIPLKDKNITITNVFQKSLDESIVNQTQHGYIKAMNFTTD